MLVLIFRLTVSVAVMLLVLAAGAAREGGREIGTLTGVDDGFRDAALRIIALMLLSVGVLAVIWGL